MFVATLRRCGEVQSFLSLPPELLRLATVTGGVPSGVAAHMQRVIDLSQQRHQLQLKKVGLLSLPASSVGARNKELLSLGVGAVSGALSLSIHPGFALIFLCSYRMYKSANKPTTDRLASPQKVRLINEELSKIEAEVAEKIHQINVLVKVD